MENSWNKAYETTATAAQLNHRAHSATDSGAALLHWTFELVSLWRFFSKSNTAKRHVSPTLLSRLYNFRHAPPPLHSFTMRHIVRRMHACIVSNRFSTSNSLCAADICMYVHCSMYLHNIHRCIYIYYNKWSKLDFSHTHCLLFFYCWYLIVFVIFCILLASFFSMLSIVQIFAVDRRARISCAYVGKSASPS